MESQSPPIPHVPSEPVASLAEGLPELYRAILDRVADLERVGARRDAGRIRVAATAAYSTAWDESCRRLLNGLLARADRALVIPDRPRGWSLRRRSAPAR